MNVVEICSLLLSTQLLEQGFLVWTMLNLLIIVLICSRFDSSILFSLPDLVTRQDIAAQYAQHLNATELASLAAVSDGWVMLNLELLIDVGKTGACAGTKPNYVLCRMPKVCSSSALRQLQVGILHHVSNLVRISHSRDLHAQEVFRSCPSLHLYETWILIKQSSNIWCMTVDFLCCTECLDAIFTIYVNRLKGNGLQR